MMKTGDYVLVPDPDYEIGDIHNHGFVGRVLRIWDGKAAVADQDNAVFDIEIERLVVLDEGEY